MEFIEYPKALYLAGAYRQVDDAEQEAAARADGYDDWAADHERANAPAAEAEPAPTRDDLKARAAELGIEHAPNISTDKLAGLVAAAQP